MSNNTLSPGTGLMDRRNFIRLTAAGLAGTALAGCGTKTGTKTAAGQRPNILFIAVDDLRPELGCYGDPFVKSPNIDSLARRGVTFTQAHCQQPVCNPSRASLMTGLRPDTLKVWDLRTNFRDNKPNALTIAQYFKQQGYFATSIGKIFHNTIQDPLSWSEEKLHVKGWPFDPDAVYLNKENLEKVEKRKQEIIKMGKQERVIDQYGKWYIKTVATECADVPDNAYYDGLQTDVALKKLEELKSRKELFFFGVGYYRPHLPFNVPKKYWDLYQRSEIPLAENDYLPKNAPLMAINNLRELRGYQDFKQIPFPKDGTLSEEQARLLKHGYLASVSYIDAQVGRLIEQLKKLDLWDNTIIALWGDHGWKLGEHNSWCKMTNYEIDTRSPLIIRQPGAPGNGKSCNRLVEFVDIFPTLCNASGLELPPDLEGTSMTPLLKEPARPWKPAVFSQFLRK
ncbi:MAG: sulfatase, partial [bacterium]|nr:sulfatase [bacterium]